MIGYVTLGTNDLPKAAGFYDALLATIGAKRYMESDSFIAWAASPTGASNEGAPGPRGEGFYAGYFRDLEGDKLNAFFMV